MTRACPGRSCSASNQPASRLLAKALALGADAVAVGRPVWWALTLGGAGGVDGLMDYFHRELGNTMLHHGIGRIGAFGREHVAPHRG